MSNNSYTPGTRVQYIGLDPRFIGVDGTIVLYNNQILIDWDNGYSFTIKAMDGHFKIIDREIKEDIKEKPCKNCSKMNDFGVKSCWWCCVSTPTDY